MTLSYAKGWNMFGCTRFLCQDATNYLQQVALVIESIGFSLVFIEIQYPAVKDKVDQWIDKFISRTKYVRLMAYYWRKSYDHFWCMTKQ